MNARWGLVLVAVGVATGGCRTKTTVRERHTAPTTVTAAPRTAASARPPDVHRKCCEGLAACLEAMRNLDSRHPDDEFCIVEGLTPFGEKPLDPLIALLKSDRFLPREAAAYALARIGPSAKRAVPALVEMLQQDPRAAAWALSQIGDVATTGHILEHIDGIAVDDVAKAFGTPIVPDLVRIVLDPKSTPERRRLAIDGIRAVEDKVPSSALPLIRALDEIPIPVSGSTHAGFRRATYAAPAAREAEIVRALCWFGQGAAPAIPRLRALVHHPDDLTRLRVRELLVVLSGTNGADALRLRIDELTGTDWLDGAHGLDAEAHAASDLTAILRGRKAGVTWEQFFANYDSAPDAARYEGYRDAVRALGALSTPDAIPGLTEALGLPDSEIAKSAAEALGRRGTSAGAAAVELERVATTHWDSGVAKAAAVALEAVAGKTVATPTRPPSIPCHGLANVVWEVSLGATHVRIGMEPDEEDPASRTLRGTPLRDCEQLHVQCLGGRGKTLRVGEDSIFVVGRGEWGDFIEMHGPHIDERKLWSDGNEIGLLVALSDAYFAVTEPGRVVQLLPSHESAPWSAKLVASLPGDFVAWEIANDHLLLIMGEGSPPETVGPFGGTPDPQRVAAYAVDRVGNVTRLPIAELPRQEQTVPQPRARRWLLPFAVRRAFSGR